MYFRMYTDHIPFEGSCSPSPQKPASIDSGAASLWSGVAPRSQAIKPRGMAGGPLLGSLYEGSYYLGSMLDAHGPKLPNLPRWEFLQIRFFCVCPNNMSSIIWGLYIRAPDLKEVRSKIQGFSYGPLVWALRFFPGL